MPPLPEHFGVTERAVRRFEPGAAAPAPPAADAVVVEEPLEIRLNGEVLAVTMRTPGDDARLALGFLFAEGAIAARADVAAVRALDGPEGLSNALDVELRPAARSAARGRLEGLARRGTITAACGVCGRRTVADLVARAGRVPAGAPLAAALVARAPEVLRAAQSIFAETGAIHAAAALDAAGRVLASAEDVGRHNAVDKVLGRLLEGGVIGRGAATPPPALLVVSGRASFEIVQKAAVAAIPAIAAVSAPTSLAVDLAEACGIALAGFVRGGRFNLYSGAGRIEGA